MLVLLYDGLYSATLLVYRLFKLHNSVFAIPSTDFWKSPILVNRKHQGISKVWNGKPSKTVLCLQKNLN